MERMRMMKTLLAVHVLFFLLEGVTGANFNLIATETPQYFTSPNYPANYPNNVYDTIRIVSFRSDWKVAISFTYFRIESSSSCSYDKLRIYDGILFSSLRGTYCGYNTPSDLYSSSDKASMMFQTDSSGNYKGFRFEYFASEDYPFEDDSLSSALILYICLGVFIPIGIILFCVVCVFVCAHAGKSKRTRVADLRVGQQNMRAQMMNAHHVQGGYVVPLQTISGPSAPMPPPMYGQPPMQPPDYGQPPMYGQPSMQPQPPMHAPPPYDAADYSTGAVPPPFNYVDPSSSHDKNQGLFNF